MADNFNMKQFLTENKLGPYSKLKEEKFYAPSYVAQKYGDKAKEIEANIEDEEDNNPNIWDLYTSLETAEETDEFVKGFLDETKEESLNEVLEPHVYERMYNLSNIKAQQAMIKAAEIMMNELTNEGFEVEEIREFFTQLIANDI